MPLPIGEDNPLGTSTALFPYTEYLKLGLKLYADMQLECGGD